MNTEHWNTYVNINLALDINKKNIGNLMYLKGKVEDLLQGPLDPSMGDLVLLLNVKAQSLIELYKFKQESMETPCQQ